MSSDHVIVVDNVSKCYEIYQHPKDRLKQFFTFSSHKYYQEFWAIRDVSFAIAKGETVGLIGKNGSGKSTILQMICGTVTPTSGSISSNGRIAALLELGAGFNPEFTGLENVYLNAEILGISRAVMKDRISLILDFSELGEKLYQPVKTYSSGMFARLAFSVAIHVDPDILIVDEALAVGDAKFVAKCMKKIKDIQAQGASILFVSHDVGSVRTLCDRVIWLDNGAKVADGEVFPTTAKYMEYMFQDDNSDDAIKHEVIPAGVDESVREEVVPTSKDNHLDLRPVTHWGDHQGLILGVHVGDQNGKKIEVINWGDNITIVIEAYLPDDIPKENLMFSCSIKDLKGTDLLVLTTHEISGDSLPTNQAIKITFSLKNLLADGKYLLAVAVEKRSLTNYHYYEYIEGACYFSSLSEQQIFGLFYLDNRVDVTYS